MANEAQDIFIDHYITAFQEKNLLEIKLSNKRDKNGDLRLVSGKLAQLKGGLHLNVIYRHETKDITKNYALEESTDLLKKLIDGQFFQGELYTSTHRYYLHCYKNGKCHLKTKEMKSDKSPNLSHDHQKERRIKSQNNPYLHLLGITTADGKVRKSGQDKFRQINKYIEIIEGIFKDASLPKEVEIADMGSGKGYLTFALYDYLSGNLNHSPHIYGIEYRQDLVDQCNKIASQCGYINLSFIQSSIMEMPDINPDVLIALHACDTATDDAIFQGINKGSQVIICAPCCHKQVRKNMNTTGTLSLITQYGIQKERQAEMLTDTIRALILEAYGYKTKVFEFISTVHTPKNVMIAAVKKDREVRTPDPVILQQIDDLKKMFGLSYHHLEKLLEGKLS